VAPHQFLLWDHRPTSLRTGLHGHLWGDITATDDPVLQEPELQVRRKGCARKRLSEPSSRSTRFWCLSSSPITPRARLPIYNPSSRVQESGAARHQHHDGADRAQDGAVRPPAHPHAAMGAGAAAVALARALHQRPAPAAPPGGGAGKPGAPPASSKRPRAKLCARRSRCTPPSTRRSCRRCWLGWTAPGGGEGGLLTAPPTFSAGDSWAAHGAPEGGVAP